MQRLLGKTDAIRYERHMVVYTHFSWRTAYTFVTDY